MNLPHDYREAFWVGCIAGLCTAGMIVWVLAMVSKLWERVASREDEVQQMHAADQEIAGRAEPPCICGTVFEINGPCQAKVHVSAEAIAQRSYRPPEFAFCGFPVPWCANCATPDRPEYWQACGLLATPGHAYCEKHAQWPKT